MTILPPSPFTDSGLPEVPRPDEAAAPSCRAPGAAVEISESIDCIGEIFIGARKLEDREISLSELCHRGFDARAFIEAIEPPPIFLQRAG
jgi:hypothetical protein